MIIIRQLLNTNYSLLILYGILACLLVTCIGCPPGTIKIVPIYPKDHPQGVIIDTTISTAAAPLITKNTIERNLRKLLTDADIKLVSKNQHHVRLKVKLYSKYEGKKRTGPYWAPAYKTTISISVSDTAVNKAGPRLRNPMDVGEDLITHYLETNAKKRSSWKHIPEIKREENSVKIFCTAIHLDRKVAKENSMEYALRDFYPIAANMVRASIALPRIPFRPGTEPTEPEPEKEPEGTEVPD